MLQCYFQTFFGEDKFIMYRKFLMFVYLLPNNVSKQNKTKHKKELIMCTLFLYLTIPHSLPLVSYNPATAELVFLNPSL